MLARTALAWVRTLLRRIWAWWMAQPWDEDEPIQDDDEDRLIVELA